MRRALTIVAAGVAAGFLSLAPASTQAGEPRQFHLTYYGYLGDVQVGNLDVSFLLPNGAGIAQPYNIRADLRLADAYAKLLPFRWQGEAQGGAGSDGVEPSRYRSAMDLLGKHEQVTVAYRPNGTVDVVSEPPTIQSNYAAEAGLGRNTIDPLSATVAIVDSLVRTGSCAANLPVFDGARRFDLRLSPEGQDMVQRTYFSTYEGPATRCSVDVKLIAGFRDDAMRSGFYPEQTDVWLAPVMENAPPVPVRILARSPAGIMRIDLIEVRALAAATP
ncbi:MAG: DUF3108 domain-containing protein [Dongiaceae bacterium]